jgi:hypothetical protein
MFTKNCFHLSLCYCDKLRSFYLSEFHDCSPISSISLMPTAPLTLLSCLLACFRLTATVFMFHSTSVGYPRSWRWSSLYARPAQSVITFVSLCYFELSSRHGSINSFARMVFYLCGSPRSSTKKLVWLDAGQLTKRGFLTLRDCVVIIYASITFALYCFTCVDAMQSSRFYTFDKVLKRCVLLCLRPTHNGRDY